VNSIIVIFTSFSQVALTLIEAAVRSSAPASKSAPPEYNFASFFRDPDAPIDEDEEDEDEASNDSDGGRMRLLM
jgi:regulator of RNase E activity RraB